MAPIVHFTSRSAKHSFTCVLVLLLCSGTGWAQKQALIDSCLAELPRMTADTGKVSLLTKLGNLYCVVNPAEGLRYASQAKSLAQQLQWQHGMATAYIIMGNCIAYQSDYAKALSVWDSARVIFEEQKDKAGLLKIIGNIGVVYEYQGDYSRALEHHFVALKYAEELDDKPSIALNLGNIGSTYNYLKNQPKALEYDLKALRRFQQLHDTLHIAMYLGNIGNIYFDWKMWDTSLKYALQALHYNEHINNNEGIARDMLNAGTVYINKGMYDQAIDYYFKALNRSKAGDYKVMQGSVLRCIGEALVSLSKDTSGQAARLSLPIAKDYGIPAGKAALLQTAISYLEQSIVINKAVNSLNELQLSYFMLSEAQRRAGYPAAALASMDQYIVIKDSVFSLESKLKVAHLETQREIDLKDKQILIDRLEVAKKRNERAFFIAGILLLLAVIAFFIRNIKLKAAKEGSEHKLQTFQARMNPHFIFNSLNSIQSLVLNGETISSIKYLSGFSKLMRQILESSSKSKILLATELRMLSAYIELEQLRFDRFSYELQVAPGINAEAVEVPAMIIQPFVENAIIHGILPKGEAGILTVSFAREDGHIICTVDDNGIGRRQSAALNADRTKEHHSHGVNLAATRLALLGSKRKGGGSITYIDKESAGVPSGTSVILQIPVL